MAIAADIQAPEAVDLYPSRLYDEPRLLERQDPVVYGTEHTGPLDREQLDAYDRDGFLVFDDIFTSDEIARYRQELTRLNNDESIKDEPWVITEPGSREVRSVFAIHKYDEILGRLLRDRRIVDIARQLLGSDVYIHQSRINYKPRFQGREFYWHSDFETWHTEDGMPRMRAVSCSITLTPNYNYNGPLMLVPGSHRRYISCVGTTPEDNYRRSLKRQDIGVPDRENLARMVEEGGITTPTGPAGTVIFFECNTMHGSNSNITPHPRSNVFAVYNSVENKVTEPYAAPKPRPTWIGERDDLAPIRPE